MTKRESETENTQVPERTHDQPAESGREEADEAVDRSSDTGRPSPAERAPATGPEGIDSTPESLEERMPRGTVPPA